MKKTKKRGPDYRGIALNLYNQRYNKPSYQTGETIFPGPERIGQTGTRTLPGQGGPETAPFEPNPQSNPHIDQTTGLPTSNEYMDWNIMHGYEPTYNPFGPTNPLDEPTPPTPPPIPLRPENPFWPASPPVPPVPPNPFDRPTPPPIPLRPPPERINYRKGTKVRPSTFTYQNGDKTKGDLFTIDDLYGTELLPFNAETWEGYMKETKGEGNEQFGGLNQAFVDNTLRMLNTGDFSGIDSGPAMKLGAFRASKLQEQKPNSNRDEIYDNTFITESVAPLVSGPYAYGGDLDLKQRQAKQQMYYGPRAPKIPDNFYSGLYGAEVPGYKPGDTVMGKKDVGVNKNIDPSLEGLHPDELTVINRERGEIVERQLPNLDEGDPGNYFVYEGDAHNDVRDGMPNGGNNAMEQIGAFITPKKYADKMEKLVINRKENQDILKTFA